MGQNYHSLNRSPIIITNDRSFASKRDQIENALTNLPIIEHNVVIQGLLRKLHAAFIHERVAQFYSYFFLGQLSMCSQQRLSDSISRELQLLKNKQTQYHLVTKYIQARQICLQLIAQTLQNLFQQQKKTDMIKLRQQIQHLRKLTSLAILQIREWKNMLLFLSEKVFEDEHIAFHYKNQDYLLKILRDTNFISNSFLSEKVTFSHKQDPFLMRPYDEGQLDNEYVNLFKIIPQDKKRYIECLQYLAEQRADYLRRKVVAKQEKIKEIERVYQTSFINQRIFATRGIKKIKMTINDVPIDFVDQSPKKQVQEPKIKLRSSSETELRQKKNRLLLIKGQKMKKIKQMDIGSNSPLINIKKFNSVQENEANSPFAPPVQRSFSLALLKKRVEKSQKIDKIPNQKQTETDFQTLLRKKQLQVLDTDLSRRRALSSIKLKDKLSQRKMIDNKQGAQQLKKILDQVEHVALQKEDQLAKSVNQSRVSQSMSMLQQNQQIISTLRQKILKQISDDSHLKKKADEKKKQEDQYLQKIIKSKLQQQELKDIQKAKNSWIFGKDKLAEDMNKSQLFGFGQNTSRNIQKLVDIENELKRQMQLKFLREVKAQLSHKQEMYKLSSNRKKEQKQRDKQLQIAMRHKEQQERFKMIEDEQRSKLMMKNIEDQERKKRQIETQLQKIIERQQQKLIEKSIESKQKLEEDMRQSMKQKLLITLKRESSISKKQKEAKEKLKMEQQRHRQEVKKKIQQQFQIEQTIERQRERQQKMIKLKLVSQKMDHLQEQMQKSRLVRQASTKNEDLSRLRENINKIPEFKPANQIFIHEEQKKKMREQFELELFAFSKPENFVPKQDNFLIRQFKNQFDNEENLDKKMVNLAENIAEQKKNQSKLEESSIRKKQSSLKAIKNDPSVTTEKFVRFSQQQDEKEQKKQKQIEVFTEQQLLKMGIQMSPDEYSVYLKKKNAMVSKRTTSPINEQLLKIKQKITAEGFQKMNLTKSNIQNIKQVKQSQSQDLSHVTIEKKSSNSKQQNRSPSRKKKQISKKQRVQESDDLSDVMKLTVHSKMNSVHKKKFATSDQQQDQRGKRKKKNQKKSKQQKRKKQQSSSSSESTHKSIQKQKSRKAIITTESTNFKSILADQIDNYLLQHFKKLPKITRRLNLLKKDELIKTINQYTTVVFIEASRQNTTQGLVIAVQNQNKQNIRSLNLIHFGSYEISNTLSLILKARDSIFLKDPCSQITFSMYFNKQDKQQDNFVKEFEKQFDPYGAIFQKNISNQITQRKHVLRRMIGEQTSKNVKNKNAGQAKLMQLMISHPNEQTLGVDLRLQKIGYSLGGWTMLCYFLANCGKEEQIVKQLTSDVSQQRKNIKHLSKMTMKMVNNRFSDLQLSSYKSAFEANLKLVQQGYQLIKCDPKMQQNNIPMTVIKNEMLLTPSLTFVTAAAQIQHKQSTYQCDFFRFKGGKGTKIFKLKSTLYSSVFTIIPCKPANYKILIVDAHEFDSIYKKIPLDLYLKLYLANISQHSQSSDQFIWLPQVSSKKNNQIQQSVEFGFNTELRSSLDFSFTQYIPNSLTFKPTHRDLFMAPPFIFAVLNSEIEKTVEGSPIFAQRIDIKDMKGLKDTTKPVQSDF